MNILTDAQVVIAFFNFITGITNIVWSLQLRSMKNDSDVIRELKESNKDKEEIIDDLRRDKENWKTQYHSLFKKFNHLEGRVKAYETIHAHPVEAQGQAKTITT